MGTPAETFAERLAWELESWKSVEVRARHEMVSREAPPSVDHNGILEHYIESSSGQRYYNFQFLKNGGPASRYAYFADGQRCADVQYSDGDPETQRSIVIKRGFRLEDQSDRVDRPVPLLYLYVGREPLHEALREAHYLGQARVLGRGCEAFLFKQVKWFVPQDQVFYLDRATSIPLKVESFSDAEARSREAPLWAWTAEELGEVQGHPVVLRSKQVDYEGQTEPTMTRTFQVESIAFDQTYPASTFWPAKQPGVPVMDAIANKVSTTPGARPEPAEAARPAAGRAIVAEPPGDWTAMMPTAALGLGVATLAAGLLLWWRRR
jgi:hypothetical protein